MHYRLLAPFMFVLLAALQSCILEDMEPCVQYDLSFTMEGSDGVQVPIESSNSIKLYLFDQNGFDRMVSTVGVDEVRLGFVKDEDYMLVAWGSEIENSPMFPTLTKGQHPEDALVRLSQLGAYSTDPTDIFYTRFTFHSEQMPVQESRDGTPALRASVFSVDTLTLNLQRIIGTMSITAKNVEKSFGTDTTGYRFVTFSPNDAINYMGKPAGDRAILNSKTSIDRFGQLVTSAIKVLPTPSNDVLIINLIKGDSLLYSTSQDYLGQPIRAVAGNHLDVLLDFGNTNVKVAVSVTPWGDIEQKTEL